MKKHSVQMTVNGRSHEGAVEARKTLADFLRQDLQLTGTHLGCEHGVCGACTVLMNGEAVRSCLLLAVQAEGAELLTIEGLDIDGRLAPLQEAMRERHAFQCGFCTPGFLLTVHALLEEHVERSTEEWRHELAGNLCRCTGYQSIVEGVERAVELLETKAQP